MLAVIASPGVSDMRSELQAAQRRLDLAQRLHQREKTLFEEKISAEQDYLQATTALQESQIAVRNATEKLAAIGAQRGGAQLNQYELRAPFDGVIVEKHISLGEAVADNATVFTLSDLRSVWAEFVVSAQDLGRVRVGQQASIHAAAFNAQAAGRVSYIGSLLGQQTRTATARVTLANPDMAWRPGLFVTVRALVDRVTAPVAVEVAAIQTVDDKPSVFVVDGDALRARPVTVGRSSSTHVEIVSGLQAGERYASGNSFVLKSELGKSSAEHTH
ncbi:efflux RND transporter periplasmic adaptor subunit [Pigmentiphaga litoralis]|uniref:efflux RND transporter periplasmic adaptor subunit n=1 Tax=Pigmentiphaga litoralis TaxID=516702 RepID=UPI003B435DCF